MTERLPELKKTSWIILLTGTLIFAISLFFWIIDFPGVRRAFVFKSSDSEILRIENRFEPLFPAQGKIRNYIDELLVGPLSEHCCTVFAKRTKVLYCFQRDQILYVNLSADLLAADAENTDFKAQIELFKKNVMLNFPEIKKIELFIDGKVPFENS
ncbi:MAG: GerMN domain-containing protein [Treponema sp.]|nr:GerMN domain-containing protein [Treponema sp.]